MVALASAFVRLRPDPNKAEFVRAGKEMGGAAGSAAGDAFGDGYKRGADGKLRDQNGKFVAGAKTMGAQGGAAAGDAFGDGYKRGADGKLRDSRGKFVSDSETAGRAGGDRAGKGFATSFGKGSSGIAASIKSNLSLAAGVFVPIGLAAAVGEIGKIGIAYEDNLNIFKTVSKATGDEMKRVADQARQLGSDVTLPGVSAAGAAAAMTELAKAGFSVSDSMAAAKATLQLARVASISEADAAEIASNAVNAFGIEAKDTGIVVDQLAAAANSSSIEVTEAGDAFKQAAAAFSGILGPSVGGKEAITELNTAIAILGNNGIKGSDAGTSLKQALLQLVSPSEQAAGFMDDINASAAGVNITMEQQDKILRGTKKEREETINSIYDHNKSLKAEGGLAYDAAGKMRPLREIIKRLTEGTKDWSQEDRNKAISTIFGADATRSVLALMKGGIPTYDKMTKAITQSGAAAEFSAAKNAGLGGAIDNVKSQFENAAIAIYNQVKGPLTNALNTIGAALPGIFAAIGRFAGFIRDNIGVIRDWAIAIALVTAAIKLNTAILAVQAAGGFLKYLSGVSIITKITRGWAAAQALLNATLLLNPVGLVIIAIVALGAALVLAYRHSETFRKVVDTVWSAIKTAIKATVDWIVGTAWPAIKRAFDAVAGFAVGLWRNYIVPAWDGIKAAISVAVQAVKSYIGLLVATFKVIAGVAVWLWQNIFSPVWKGISKVVEIAWLAIQIIFKLLANIIRNVVGKAVTWLYENIFRPVFTLIKGLVAQWWEGMKRIFGLFQQYILGPIKTSLNTMKNAFVSIFNLIKNVVSNWYNNNIRPLFTAAGNAWRALADRVSSVYNNTIKPIFQRFIDFIKKNVVGGFEQGVSLIGKAWDKVKETARKPVAFVVNSVINPFIRGLNKAAGVVGVKDRVSEIGGFASGGRVGMASGGKISGAGSFTDNKQAWVPGRGAVQLMGGEFIVNRQDTSKALPLLRWVNAGMKGGAQEIARYLGKPLASEPGDGSEGWAFKDGGLFGFFKDTWNAISNPVETMKKPFNALLDRIPGGGRIKDFLVGSGRFFLNSAVSWLTKAGGGKGVGKAQSFVRSQAGKPYVWASAGPNGYDCSGIVSAAYNIMRGKNPYSHTFSTGSLPGSYFSPGKTGPLMAGWSHPGQRPASASVGHMAGQIGGLPFESTGSGGVRVGERARRIGAFASQGAARFADGGLLDEKIRLFDSGGYWPSGTLGANLSGRTEYVDPKGQGGGGGDTFIFQEGAFAGAIMTNGQQTEDLVVAAYKSAKRKRRIT